MDTIIEQAILNIIIIKLTDIIPTNIFSDIIFIKELLINLINFAIQIFNIPFLKILIRILQLFASIIEIQRLVRIKGMI